MFYFSIEFCNLSIYSVPAQQILFAFLNQFSSRFSIFRRIHQNSIFGVFIFSVINFDFIRGNRAELQRSCIFINNVLRFLMFGNFLIIVLFFHILLSFLFLIRKLERNEHPRTAFAINSPPNPLSFSFFSLGILNTFSFQWIQMQYTKKWIFSFQQICVLVS